MQSVLGSSKQNVHEKRLFGTKANAWDIFRNRNQNFLSKMYHSFFFSNILQIVRKALSLETKIQFPQHLYCACDFLQQFLCTYHEITKRLGIPSQPNIRLSTAGVEHVHVRTHQGMYSSSIPRPTTLMCLFSIKATAAISAWTSLSANSLPVT